MPERTCSVDGCATTVAHGCRSACEFHRFVAKFEEAPAPAHAAHLGRCWLWTGGKRHGYGATTAFGQLRSHRSAWVLYRGLIPDGMHVLHRCDVKACGNPAHLYLGTHAENMADLTARGYRPGWGEQGGERNNGARLTWEQVRRIRAERAAGATLASLASVYGVTESNVSMIARRVTWVE